MTSEPSFDEQLLEHLPALGYFARTLCRQGADAEDLVQETIAKALLHQEKYVPYGSLKSWLFTIMKNTFCSKLKKARRETWIDDWDGAAPPSQDEAMALQDLGRAYEKLPEIYRSVLELVVFDGLQYDEAAQQSGCSVGTIKSRLHRARAFLSADDVPTSAAV